jgi:hypothetical protein
VSHPKFHAGEQARMMFSDLRPELAGRLCEIVEPLRERMMDGPNGKVAQLVYVVKIDGAAGLFGVQEPALAKAFDAGDWLDVLASTGWTPDRRVRIPLKRNAS